MRKFLKSVTDPFLTSCLQEQDKSYRMSIYSAMEIWCAFAVCILGSLVKGSPRIELLEVTSTAFCNDNFQMARLDYTVLKYNITGMNSDYKMESFMAPMLLEFETQNIICPTIDPYTGACSHLQSGVDDCRCDQISDDEYHFTYNRTADPDISNVTVFMHWSSRRGVIDSDHYTFKPVVTDQLNVDGKYLRILRNLYWEQVAAIRIDGEYTDFTEIKRGVRQGCVLSPDLLNLYNEVILRNITDMEGVKVGGRNITNLRYADDTVLIANSQENVQALLSVVTYVSESMGLQLNAKKTECMVVSF
ncbi:retrovirus-related Pol polyprotein LINE-1 [Elysia marginata]|uniref:Retrovirus-related Pol polyprotein LINE-1 n=1 Tax=Elysia marginata TaxID=1093978 RepID=A0AAV4GEJ3_9GAST|nr:retrovirus-related Pol polyprotein LINE-1 [Elysia marginata]